jgi:hypothetical protein
MTSALDGQLATIAAPKPYWWLWRYSFVDSHDENSSPLSTASSIARRGAAGISTIAIHKHLTPQVGRWLLAYHQWVSFHFLRISWRDSDISKRCVLTRFIVGFITLPRAYTVWCRCEAQPGGFWGFSPGVKKIYLCYTSPAIFINDFSAGFDVFLRLSL